MTGMLAGATGLVGSEFVRLASEAAYPLTAVGRRDVEGVAATIGTKFSAPFALPPADVALCALGTTMGSAPFFL
jgi:uncharacterized protein YbjT (DUF2867 family)